MDHFGSFRSPWSNHQRERAAQANSMFSPGSSRVTPGIREEQTLIAHVPFTQSEEWMWENQPGFADELREMRTGKTSLEIAVAPESYPEKKFTKSEYEELERYITENLLNENLPYVFQFKEAREANGLMVIDCGNSFTVRWVMTLLDRNLKVGIKTLWRVSFVCPRALVNATPNFLLNTLVSQNPLLCGTWIFQGEETEPSKRQLMYLVDRELLNAIKKAQGKAYLGMQTIKFDIWG